MKGEKSLFSEVMQYITDFEKYKVFPGKQPALTIQIHIICLLQTAYISQL